MMRRYAEHTGCRRSFLLSYFGQAYARPVRELRQRPRRRPAEQPAQEPFAIGERVTSERWGEGTVQRYDGDQLTVLFDEHGYRDLLVPLVVERQLLRRRSCYTEPNGSVSDHVDRAFAALGDPTRRAVLERLGTGSATISELAEPFGMSLTGMRKHVRLLEEAELVTTEKVGRVRRCMLVPYAFEGISTWLQRLDRFAQVVERTKGAR